MDTTRAATILWDEYEVIELVGGGSFGHVYRCRNIKNGKYYAIKKFKNKFSSKK
jgi:serine/threonine protein kinase